MTTTFDPANTGTDIALSNGNLTASQNGNTQGGNFEISIATTSHASGKFYFEVNIDIRTTNGVNWLAGFCQNNQNVNNFPGSVGDAGWVRADMTVTPGNGFGIVTYNAANVPFSLAVSGDVLGFAMDVTAGKAWVSYNNTFGGTPSTGTNPAWTFTSGTWFPLASFGYFGGATFPQATLHTAVSNQAFSPPAGFTAWDGAGAASTPFTMPQRLIMLKMDDQ